MKQLKFDSYEKFLELFEAVELQSDMNSKFSALSLGKDYKCTLLIYYIRNLNILEDYFNINYNKNLNETLAVNNAFNSFAPFPSFGAKGPKVSINNQTFTNIFNQNQNNGLFSNSFSYGNNNLSFFNNNNNNIGNNTNTNNPFAFNFGNPNQLSTFNLNNGSNGLFSSKISASANEKFNKIKSNLDDDNVSVFSETKLEALFNKLISLGANIMEKDSNGLDILKYAVIENNLELIKFFFLKHKSSLLYDTIDNEGKSLIHYVISPIRGASYQNAKLLKYLINIGFKYDIKDIFGKTPIDYCIENQNEVYKQVFRELSLFADETIKVKEELLIQEKENNLKSESVLSNKENYISYFQEIDYEKDFEFVFNENIKENKNVKDFKVLPDSVGCFDITNHFVVKEANLATDSEDYYDVTLTNVNLMNGIYGQYLFYKMQLIHDLNRNVYILWNRWGSIDETGAYQRTPFISLNDAKQEFKKIFKSKTGNDWENKNCKLNFFIYFFCAILHYTQYIVHNVLYI